ncbi:MAG: CorA family divalent cation transporter [Candidatus Bathyarchaeota archaeon]
MNIAGKAVDLQFFDDVDLFTIAVEDAGFNIDFLSVIRLNTTFLKPSEKYLILNIKDYDDEDPNNLIFLYEEKAFLYSKKHPTPNMFEAFKNVCNKLYGVGTVLVFLTLNKALTSYKTKLENLINSIKKLEQTFELKEYRDTLLEFERLFDRIEDFNDIIIRLEERSIKEVNIQHISFDYSILIAETKNLLDRCRIRLSMLKDIARDNAMHVTTVLNRRIERLNNVVKKLTALTVILMIPTLIASHYGMNFAYMPELRVPFAYPAVTLFQIAITLITIFILRRIGWL